MRGWNKVARSPNWLPAQISARFLEAIESDRRDQLPAGFFFRNWAMQYAQALSLNEKEIQDPIDHILSAEAPLPLPGQVQSESKDLVSVRGTFFRGNGAPRLMLSFSLLVIVVVGCSGFYAWWHKQQQERQNNLGPSPIARVEHKELRATPAVKPSAPRFSQPVQASAAETPAEGAAGARVSVELHAREQTWLVISPDGKQVFAGVLEANESKTVEAHDSARIKIGNAGGIDIRLNGKPVGEIGPKGKVRVLVLDPNGVRIVESRRSATDQLSPVAALDSGAALALSLE